MSNLKNICFVVVIVFVFVVILLLLYFVFVIDFYEFVLWIFWICFVFLTVKIKFFKLFHQRQNWAQRIHIWDFVVWQKAKREENKNKTKLWVRKSVKRKVCVFGTVTLKSHGWNSVTHCFDFHCSFFLVFRFILFLLFCLLLCNFQITFLACDCCCCCFLSFVKILFVLFCAVCLWLCKLLLVVAGCCFVLFGWFLLLLLFCFVLLKMKLKFNLFCCLQQQTLKTKFFQIWLFWQRQHKVKTWDLIVCEKKTKTQSTKEIEMRICVLFCVWDLTKIGSKIKITNWKQNPASNFFWWQKNSDQTSLKWRSKKFKVCFDAHSQKYHKKPSSSTIKTEKNWKCQCGCCRKSLAMMWEGDTVSNEQLASLSREYFEGKGFSSFKEHLFAYFSFGGHSWMLSALCSSRSPVSIGEIEKPLSCVHFHPVVWKTIMNKILAILVLFCVRKSQQVTTMEIPLRNVQQQLSKLFSKSMASSCLCCIFDCEHQNQPWPSLQQNPQKVLHDFVWISNVNPIEFKFHCILDFVLLGFLLLGVLRVVQICGDWFLFVSYFEIWHQSNCAFQIHPKFRSQFQERPQMKIVPSNTTQTCQRLLLSITRSLLLSILGFTSLCQPSGNHVNFCVNHLNCNLHCSFHCDVRESCSFWVFAVFDKDEWMCQITSCQSKHSCVKVQTKKKRVPLTPFSLDMSRWCIANWWSTQVTFHNQTLPHPNPIDTSHLRQNHHLLPPTKECANKTDWRRNESAALTKKNVPCKPKRSENLVFVWSTTQQEDMCSQNKNLIWVFSWCVCVVWNHNLNLEFIRNKWWFLCQIWKISLLWLSLCFFLLWFCCCCILFLWLIFMNLFCEFFEFVLFFSLAR